MAIAMSNRETLQSLINILCGIAPKFAELLFKQFRVEVTIVTETQAIEKSHYDFVVNCDVLEHVPDPRLLISEIEQYLKQDGLALVTEAFGWLEPYAVSHLLSNVAYVGKLPRLFAAYNMHFIQRKSGSRLHVYTKAKGQELKRQRRLLGYSSVSAWKLYVREKMTVLKRRLKRQYPFNKKMSEEGNRFREAILQYGKALELTFDHNADPEKCLDLLLGHNMD